MHQITIHYPETGAVRCTSRIQGRRGVLHSVKRHQKAAHPVHRTAHFSKVERLVRGRGWESDPVRNFSVDVVEGTWEVGDGCITFRSSGGGVCTITRMAEVEPEPA